MHVIASLSTVDFDPLGVVRLRCTPQSGLPEQRRRINRIATLDGGAVVNDFGYADADATLTLTWPTTAATHAAVQRLVRLHGTVRVALASGVFMAAVDAYTPGPAESSLVLFVTERLAGT